MSLISTGSISLDSTFNMICTVYLLRLAVLIIKINNTVTEIFYRNLLYNGQKWNVKYIHAKITGDSGQQYFFIQLIFFYTQILYAYCMNAIKTPTLMF